MVGKAAADTKRVLWYLKKVPLLAGLSGERLAVLAPQVQLTETRRRQVIYMPGDPARTVHFVNGGRVKVSRVTRDGKELTLAYRGPGEIFGEQALASQTPRREMAEAMENALLTTMPREILEGLLEEHAVIARRLVKILAERRGLLEDKVEGLLFRDVSSRIAELLVQLSVEYGVRDPRGTVVGLRITHQEMANLIGSTRETVSLILSQLRRRGLLHADGRRLLIADPVGLRALL